MNVDKEIEKIRNKYPNNKRFEYFLEVINVQIRNIEKVAPKTFLGGMHDLAFWDSIYPEKGYWLLIIKKFRYFYDNFDTNGKYHGKNLKQK